MNPNKTGRGILASLGRIGDPPLPWPQGLYSLEINDLSEFERLDPQSPFYLTDQQMKFADTMACFVNQARRERRDEAFLGHCYGRFFTKWPEPRHNSANFAWNQIKRKEFFRLQLLQSHRQLYPIEPKCDWETVLSLPALDYLLVSDHLLKKARELRGGLLDDYRVRIDDLQAHLDAAMNDQPMENTDEEDGTYEDDESMQQETTDDEKSVDEDDESMGREDTGNEESASEEDQSMEQEPSDNGEDEGSMSQGYTDDENGTGEDASENEDGTDEDASENEDGTGEDAGEDEDRSSVGAEAGTSPEVIVISDDEE